MHFLIKCTLYTSASLYVLSTIEFLIIYSATFSANACLSLASDVSLSIIRSINSSLPRYNSLDLAVNSLANNSNTSCSCLFNSCFLFILSIIGLISSAFFLLYSSVPSSRYVNLYIYFSFNFVGGEHTIIKYLHTI